MADPLHTLLRHTVITAWQKLDGVIKLKGLVKPSPQEMIENYGSSEGFEQLVMCLWGCGDSASRLCKILVDDELEATANKGLDVADDAAMKTAFQAMQQVKGYFLARMNMVGAGASHAYVFLSRYREKPSSPLEGHIYQTNIGLQNEDNFDLIDWINDKKSSEPVYLPGYLVELQAQLAGSLAANVYEQDFSLSGRPLKEKDKEKIGKAAAKGLKVKLAWKAVDQVLASKNLKALMA